MCRVTAQVLFAFFVALVAYALTTIEWIPPRNIVPRTQPVDPTTTSLDNNFYDNTEFAEQWWDPEGWANGLHKMNSVRVAYFDRAFQQKLPGKGVVERRQLFLDIGCGGGLVTEQMGKRGYAMLGLDISTQSILAARKHAHENNITTVTYKVASAFEIPLKNASVDGIIMSDVLEHIHDLPKLAKELARVLKPNGVFTFDTINRTWKSWLLAIMLGQNPLFALVPAHTHDYRLFITPEELTQVLAEVGIEVQSFSGLEPLLDLKAPFRTGRFQSVLRGFAETKDTEVSYLGWARKKQPT